MRVIIKSVRVVEYVDYLTSRIPFAEWCFDKHKDHMETFLRALAMAKDDPCLHMEDDIILTRRFMDKVQRVVDSLDGDRVVQFFSMRNADLTTGSRWDSNFLMNQCSYFPADYSRSLLKFSNEWRPKHPEHPTGSDVMINDWLRSRKERYWIHVPSLVEHRADVSNINPRRPKTRQSKTFVDPWV